MLSNTTNVVAHANRPPALQLSTLMNTHKLIECSSLCMARAKNAHLAPLSRGAQNAAFIRDGVFMKVSKRGVDMLGGYDWDEFLNEKDRVRASLRFNCASTRNMWSFPDKFWMACVNGTQRLCSETRLVMGEPLLSWARRLRHRSELWAVEMQLMACLWALQEACVYHNDCHPNNVMISKGCVESRTMHVMGRAYTVQTRYTPVLVDWDKCTTRRDSHITRHVFRALSMFGGHCAVKDAVDYVAGTLSDDGHHYATTMPCVAAFLGLS